MGPLSRQNCTAGTRRAGAEGGGANATTTGPAEAAPGTARKRIGEHYGTH